MPRPARRASAIAAAPAPASPAPRRGRGRKVKEEPATPVEEDLDLDDDDANVGEDDEDDEEEEEEEEEAPRPGPSRRRSKGRPSTTRRRSTKIEDEPTDVEDEAPPPSSSRRRSAKQVSYKEIPVEVDVNDDDDDDDEDEPAVSTPARGRRSSGRPKKAAAEDKPYKREPGTGGRGGFSVKGAAAAAARARWDKVRRERAERGEDVEEKSGGGRRAKPPPKEVVIKRDPRGALENVIEGHKYSVKNVEYVAGDDELIIPEDEKGNTKVDAEGRLLGGREYKLVTFTSPTRKNPERVYALTIDAARACGYTDSLAFLRRCPQIVKLSCGEEERQMLIDIGRITGNLKHRMVTMVAMRNVYKLMGARVVKDGKWVTDDYNEEQGLADCAANGWTPHGPVLEEELAVNQYPSAGGPGRPPANAGLLADAAASKPTLSSFYQVGGPTTHFGGNGSDPWSDLGHGKRGRLRALGVTEEDWILRTAEDARRIDEVLRGYREERIGVLEGPDAYCWVYNAERRATGELPDDKEEPKAEPTTGAEGEITPAVKPHPLASELTFDASSEPLSPLPPDPPTATALAEVNETAEFEKTPGGKIIVESESETAAPAPVGRWIPGTIQAAYEPHTQMPHVPLRTQPSAATINRMAYNPLIGMNGAARLMPAPGIASVEFVFDPTKDMSSWLAFGDGTRGRDVVKERLAAVAEAEEWERQARAKRRKMRDERTMPPPTSVGAATPAA